MDDDFFMPTQDEIDQAAGEIIDGHMPVSRQAAIGSELIALLNSGFTLVICSFFDGERHFISASAGNNTDQRRAEDESLLSVLQQLNKTEPVKHCCKCKETKPLSSFSGLINRSCGKGDVCKRCMREREANSNGKDQ